MSIFNLLVLASGVSTEVSDTASSSAASSANNGWITWVIFGVLLLIIIVPTFLRNKKEKKAYEDKISKITVGATVKTIGLIIGEIIAMDDATVTIKTGAGENFSYITVEKRAIYEVVPSENVFEDQEPVQTSEETTESVEASDNEGEKAE